MSTRVASPALYRPGDEVGSQTPGRLRPGDLSLVYLQQLPYLVDLLWSKSTKVLSCTPSLKVMLN
jgi:hypothetical protein